MNCTLLQLFRQKRIRIASTIATMCLINCTSSEVDRRDAIDHILRHDSLLKTTFTNPREEELFETKNNVLGLVAEDGGS